MAEKQMVVVVKFQREGRMHKVKMKALHNGFHCIGKESYTGDLQSVFKYAMTFIYAYDASKVALKKGIIEDSFTRYMLDNQDDKKEIKEAHGILLDTVSDEEKEILADLTSYYMYLEVTVSHRDYASTIFQGILYLNAREEFISMTGQIPNPFNATVQIPVSDKVQFMDAVFDFNQMEQKLNKPTLQVKGYNSILELTKKDYKLVVEFIN